MTLLLGSVFCLARAPQVQAAETVAVSPNAAFGVRIALQRLPSTTYAIKLRFSHHPVQCEPKCTGSTWSESWQDQTDAWRDMPRLVADENGRLSGIVYGLAPSSIPPYLQVATREEVAETTVVKAEETIGTFVIESGNTLALSAFSAAGKSQDEGYFALVDMHGERILPLFSTASVYVRTNSTSVQVGFYSFEHHEVASLQRFTLQGDGYYALALQKPALLPVRPKIQVSGELAPYEEIKVALATESPYVGLVQWYRDGLALATEPSVSFTFPQAGTYRIEAKLDTGDSAYVDLVIRSHRQVSIQALLPNPRGADAGNETLTLRNGNSYSVRLHAWSLRRRGTRTTIPLALVLPAEREVSVPIPRGLVNTGGTYDLFDESNVLVDTITYDSVPEGAPVVRQGISWVVDRPVSPSVKESSESVGRIRGKVTKPSGRTIDILTDENEAVRIVLHPSFTGGKPALRKGDTVEATGEWRRSTRGPYLSVRAGHSFALLATAPSRTKEQPGRRKRIVASAQAQVSPLTLSRSSTKTKPPPQASAIFLAPYTTPLGLRVVWTVLLLFGLGLALPRWQARSV